MQRGVLLSSSSHHPCRLSSATKILQQRINTNSYLLLLMNKLTTMFSVLLFFWFKISISKWEKVIISFDFYKNSCNICIILWIWFQFGINNEKSFSNYSFSVLYFCFSFLSQRNILYFSPLISRTHFKT